MTVWRDLQDDLAARRFDSHDSETPRCDLQSDDFEQVLGVGGQSSEAVEQFPETGRLCLDRNLLVICVLTGGTENAA